LSAPGYARRDLDDVLARRGVSDRPAGFLKLGFNRLFVLFPAFIRPCGGHHCS